MKTCTGCGQTKPLDEFNRHKRNKTDGRSSWCKECHAAHQRNKRATDPAFAERNRQLCAARRRGEKLEPTGLARPTDELFDEKLLLQPNGCLIWAGAVGKHSYGNFALNGKIFRAHRFAYWRRFGVIPKPEIHHTCGNRLCCEPSHLLAVTRAEHEAIHKNVKRPAQT